MNNRESYIRKLLREQIRKELNHIDINEGMWSNIVSRVKAINQAGKDVEEKNAFNTLNKNVRAEIKSLLTTIIKKQGSYLNKYLDALQSGRTDLTKDDKDNSEDKIKNVNEVLYEAILSSVIDIISKDYGSPDVVSRLLQNMSASTSTSSSTAADKETTSTASTGSSQQKQEPNPEAGMSFGQKQKQKQNPEKNITNNKSAKKPKSKPKTYTRSNGDKVTRLSDTEAEYWYKKTGKKKTLPIKNNKILVNKKYWDFDEYVK